MKKNKLYLIYIPGLGDHNSIGQKIAVTIWKIWGVQSELWRMNWNNDIDWEEKLARILKHIDELSSDHSRICLIGASAGAGAVINIFEKRKEKIHGCVIIAGKVNNPSAISMNSKFSYHSFYASSAAAPAALSRLTETDRVRILSRYGLQDEVVPKKDSIIQGGVNQVSPTIGHFFTIAYQLTFGAPSFIRFLNNLRITYN